MPSAPVPVHMADDARRDALRAIHAAIVERRIGEAQTLARAAVAEGIEHPMALSVAAAGLEDEGLAEQALILLQRAHSLANGDPGIANALGLCLQKLDRHTDAIAVFDDALRTTRDFSPAIVNRAASLVAEARLVEARVAYERALSISPHDPLALAGLAALELRRGTPAAARPHAMACLRTVPGFPSAELTLAECDIAEGQPDAAEARLAALIDRGQMTPHDSAIATGLVGDARDARCEYRGAFGAYRDCGAKFAAMYAPRFVGQVTPQALLRSFTEVLRTPRAVRPVERRPQQPLRHAFLVGFPRSGTTLLEQVLEQHPDVVTLAEKECLADSASALRDAASFARFLAIPEKELASMRTAYWARVAEHGISIDGRLFVDKHPFHSFKLPLIARLFPDAAILFAERDPRDVVLSCFRRQFRISAPTYQFLTIEGVASLYDATMTNIAVTWQAFAPRMLRCRLENMIAAFEPTTRALCAGLGIEWHPALADFAGGAADRGVFTPSSSQIAEGLNARGVGTWRHYADDMAGILPTLAPWVDRFGYD